MTVFDVLCLALMNVAISALVAQLLIVRALTRLNRVLKDTFALEHQS